MENEIGKYHKNRDNIKAIVSFMEYLENRGLRLCEPSNHPSGCYCIATREPTHDIAMQFYGIDKMQLEKEREQFIVHP